MWSIQYFWWFERYGGAKLTIYTIVSWCSADSTTLDLQISRNIKNMESITESKIILNEISYIIIILIVFLCDFKIYVFHHGEKSSQMGSEQIHFENTVSLCAHWLSWSPRPHDEGCMYCKWLIFLKFRIILQVVPLKVIHASPHFFP